MNLPMGLRKPVLGSLASLAAVLILQGPHGAHAAVLTDMYNLHEKLFSDQDYKKGVRPIEDDNFTLLVYMAFSLVSLVDVNEREQNMVTNARLRVFWKDILLTWRPEDYGNITSFLIWQEDIWLPDLQVANSVVMQTQIGYETLPVRLFSTGGIMWNPMTVLSTACSIDVTYYPMDTQVCYIVFETSMSTRHEIFITLDLTTPISLAEFSEDGQWEIADTSSENLVDIDLKTMIRFGFSLRRRRAYYIVNIIMPVIFLSLTSTMVFALPANAGEKMSMAITVLLAYSVYLTIVSDHLPNTSVQTSILAVYLTTLLGITAVSTVVSVFILKLHHRSAGDKVGRRTQKLVFFLKRITFTLSKEDKHVSKNIISPSEDGDSRSATENQAVADRRLSSPPVYHAPMTWQDVAQAVDWFLFMTFTIFSLLLTVITMTILIIGADRSAPTLSHMDHESPIA